MEPVEKLCPVPISNKMTGGRVLYSVGEFTFETQSAVRRHSDSEPLSSAQVDSIYDVLIT